MSIIRKNVYWPFRVLDSFFDDEWDPLDLTLLRIPEMEHPKLDNKEEDTWISKKKIPQITPEYIDAQQDNGLLTLKLPKKNPELPKKIEIKDYQEPKELKS
jgi:hypothetical protein